jgi:hypothetical protein
VRVSRTLHPDTEILLSLGDLSCLARVPRLRPGVTAGERWLAHQLQTRLKLPNLLLTVLFSIKPSVWVGAILWIVGAPIAARLDLVRVW